MFRKWYQFGSLPANEYSQVLTSYLDGHYRAALYYLLLQYSHIYVDSPFPIHSMIFTQNDTDMYTKYIPDYVLVDLIERYIFEPNLPAMTEMQCKIALSEWFSDRAREGLLSFQPYVYSECNHLLLVLKYNRLLSFNGVQWEIKTSDASNSYWYQGEDLDRLHVHSDSNLASMLLWSSMLNVGSRMSEFRDLLIHEPQKVDTFVNMVASAFGYPTQSDSYMNLFGDCLHDVSCDSVLSFRVQRNDTTDWARFDVRCPGEYFVELPCGLVPKRILCDFSGFIEDSVLDLKDVDDVGVILLKAVFALSGLLIDDKVCYSVNKDKYLWSGYNPYIATVTTL
ncbi:MAG: hypothetical protein NC548_10640 [Lachnospiraceae bacterium]|nr:hypothetical protein [Lachnospiraceae bacterium]